MSKAQLTDFDLHLLGEGTHERLYEKMGAHLAEIDGKKGTHFAVWAPNAKSVSVIGDFNDWREGAHPMQSHWQSGVWTLFVPDMKPGSLYKYAIESSHNNYRVQKMDPYGFASELRPRTASMVWDVDHYAWQDTEWMKTRHKRNSLDAPISVYEVHLGSWRRKSDEENRWLTYRELADELPDYVHDMGYTHVEFLPVNEHPFDGSWGYQPVGYFTPTSRFGTPDDFKFLVDKLHQRGIGVFLDWVPAHFPTDDHGLAFFDGTHLYEHAHPMQREHKDWGTYIFNYGRHEVANFLLSSAIFWLDKYHIDGLRVDAVASMLYLDYSRKEGEWIPNQYGGRENLEAIHFLRLMNERIYAAYPDVITAAEESTSWPQVSRPTYIGGLGFGLKWDMGWMHDTLNYFSENPIHRKYHHNLLTFRMLYAWMENFMLPLSHDEVVHGKKALLSKMPGDMWQQFANLRLLYGYMYAQPAKKLLFMGGEIGQWTEWNHDASLDWHLLEYPTHQGLQRWVKDLNNLYRREPAMHKLDCQPEGFEWVDCCDTEHSVVSLIRKTDKEDDTLLIVCNFTPVPRDNYAIGVPTGGYWHEMLNSDAADYGGSGSGNFGGVVASEYSTHARPYTLSLVLPPLSMLVFKRS